MTDSGSNGVVDYDARSKIALWLLCGVGLGILPVMANLVTPLFTAGMFDLAGPLSDGELLIAATAIAGGALGELLQVRVQDLRAQMWINTSGGFTILFCALCAFAYAVTKISPGHGAPHIETTFGSIVLFLLTVMTATACVKLSASARTIT